MPNIQHMIELLRDDLKNEWKHLRFYAYHASAIVGFHAHEYKELLTEQATSELNHVIQFSDLIIGLGGVAAADSNDFPLLTDPIEIMVYAVGMEAEVVKNYAERIEQLTQIPIVDEQTLADKRWIEIFLEKQIEDSRQDLDHFKQILRGL